MRKGRLKVSIRLTSVFGPSLDLELGPDDLPVVIGRGDQADITIDDRWVSRVHCLLSLVDERLVVRDLESKHGTFVNESPVSSAELTDGDRLEVGLSTIVVRQHADSCIRSGEM